MSSSKRDQSGTAGVPSKPKRSGTARTKNPSRRSKKSEASPPEWRESAVISRELIESAPIRLPILRCGVYVLYANEDSPSVPEGAEVVYVGRSYSFAYRRISKAIERTGGRHDLTCVRFYPCRSRKEANALERELVLSLNPIENKVRFKGSGTEHVRGRA